jgi:hypothetical protein
VDTDELTGTVTRGRPASALAALDPALARQWGKDAKQRKLERVTPVLLELPSGKTVQAIKASMRWLYKHNMIPDHLTARVQEMIDLITSADPKHVQTEMEKQFAADIEGSFAKWLDLMNACWMACVVNPKFTEDEACADAEDEPFWVGDVDYLDKLFLYQWVEGVDLSVEEFLHQQAEIVGALQDGEGVRLSAESDLRVDRTGRFIAGDPGRPGGDDVRVVHPGPDRGTDRKTRQPAKKATNRTRPKVQSGRDS